MGLPQVWAKGEPGLRRIKNQSSVLTPGMIRYSSHHLPHGGVEKGPLAFRGSPGSRSWYLGLL